MMMKTLILSAVLSFLQAGTSLDDPVAEARAQDLMREIRCVACENEPISQSGSDIAADMRARVREMVGNGQSNAEIRAWFVTRYGEFVLFRPRSDGVSGGVLWGLPFLLLVAGAVGLVLQRRSRGAAAEPIEAVAADAPDGTAD